MHVFDCFSIYLVYDKFLMHDHPSFDENFFSTRSILQTSTFQENRFDEEHVKHLSLRNIGMFGLLS